MKILKSFTAALITFCFIYLMSSFSNISFDISKWTDFSRNFVAVIGGFCSVMAFSITFDKIHK